MIYGPGKHLDQHLDQFDDDLKEKILDYYHEYIGSRWETNEDVADLTRFME